MTLFNPSVINEILINIVEIMKAEFLIILWNKSELKNENNNKKTSTSIKIWKSSSKKIVFNDFISDIFSFIIYSLDQLYKWLNANRTISGTRIEEIHFLILINFIRVTLLEIFFISFLELILNKKIRKNKIIEVNRSINRYSFKLLVIIFWLKFKSEISLKILLIIINVIISYCLDIKK